MKVKVPIWHGNNGEIIACTEKIKVMQENIDEMHQIIRDAYEDALIMGVNSDQIKNFIVNLINELKNPYKE